MKLRQERKEEDQIPFGYGIAYADLKRDVWVLYPIPVNLMVRFLSRIHDALRAPLWGRNESYDDIVQSNLKLAGKVSQLIGMQEFFKERLNEERARYRQLESEFIHLKKMK